MGDRNNVLILFILDESGSMKQMRDAAVEAFNDFIDEEPATATSTWMSVTSFSSRLFVRCIMLPFWQVFYLLQDKDYWPAGGSALFDAIGSTVTDAQRYLRRHPGQYDSVTVVILTDGYENASVNWTRAKVADLIAETEAAGWQYIYLEADPDAWDDSGSLNGEGLEPSIRAEHHRDAMRPRLDPGPRLVRERELLGLWFRNSSDEVDHIAGALDRLAT